MKHLRILLLLFVALACTSCVYSRLDGSTSPSHAFDRPAETKLGETLMEIAAEHPGDSALFELGSGLDAFAARIALINGADHAIDAQYYILHHDLTGSFFVHRLLAAADRGVRVRLLIDDIGTSGLDDVFAAANAHPNFEVRLFNPRARGNWSGLAKTLDTIKRPSRINRRMHNKMLSADGVAVIVGGQNIGDEYFEASEGVNFGDLDLLAFGPVVAEAGESFDLYWNSSLVGRLDGWSPFDREPEDVDELRAELQSAADDAQGSSYVERISKAQFVQQAGNGELPLIYAPTRAISDLPWKIISRGDEVEPTMLIHRAKVALPPPTHELLIVSPYFIPRDEGTQTLCDKVADGVSVRILTNALAATDVPVVHAGYKQYRRELVEGGVDLHELMPTSEASMEGHRQGLLGSKSASLHAKAYVIDRRYVFVGSLNLDPRSVELNTELGLIIDSTELAEQICANIETAMDPSTSWTLAIEDGDLVWNGVRNGQPVPFTKEPDTSWWTRFKVGVSGILPIEGQL
jgi:cardiolipin synthase C